MSDLKQMVDQLEPDFIAVTPSQRDQVYRESKAVDGTASTTSPH
jgi:hypothetical protein